MSKDIVLIQYFFYGELDGRDVYKYEGIFDDIVDYITTGKIITISTLLDNYSDDGVLSARPVTCKYKALVVEGMQIQGHTVVVLVPEFFDENNTDSQELLNYDLQVFFKSYSCYNSGDFKPLI